MARSLTSGVEYAVDSKNVALIVMVSIKFASTTEYVWSGIGTFSYGGHQWKGLGDLGKISNISESVELQAEGTSLELSGIANNILADSLTEIRVGRPVNVYLGFLNTSTGVLIPDPILVCRGCVDQPQTTVGGETSTVNIALENKLNDMQRGRTIRLCSEDQKRKYPNDTGLDFVPQLVNSVWAWGG